MANAQGNAAPQGNALVHYPTTQQPSAAGSRLEDHEPGFDRPPPKDNAELFNPKGARRVPELTRTSLLEITAEFPKQKGLLKTDTVFTGLVETTAGISLEDRPGSGESVPQHGVQSAGRAEGPENAGDL